MSETERLRKVLESIAEWCESYGDVQKEPPLPGVTIERKLAWAQEVIAGMGWKARKATIAPDNRPTHEGHDE